MVTAFTPTTDLTTARTAPGSTVNAADQQATDEATIGLRTPPAARPAPAAPQAVDNANGGPGYIQYDVNGSPVKNPGEDPRIAARQTGILNYAQNLTDSINQTFASKIQGDKDLIAGQDARARVLNTRAGLNDSGTGSAAIDQVQQKGAKVIAADEAQRNSAIGVALGKIDSLRANQEKADAAQSANDLKAFGDLRAKNTKDATDSLSALANGNVNLNTLKAKEPQTYATLQKSLGLSDLEMAAKFNSLKKPASQINYTYVTDRDGLTYGYGVDPTTGQMVETGKQKLPGLQPGDTLTHTKDGQLLIKTAAGAYKPVTPPKPTSYSANQQTDALNWLARQKGYNDAIDKEKFNSDPQYKAWAIQQAEAEKAAAKKKPGASTNNPFGITVVPGSNTA